jgi:dUTP pyrophosphatase
MKIKFKKINDKATQPTFGSKHSAAMDLYSCEPVELEPGEYTLVKTGIVMEIPEGYWGNIRDRSGLAAKHAIHTLAGVIDSDYRGELKIAMINLSKEIYSINIGDRIAQMIISQHESPELEEVSELDDTDRGAGSFGSTGY